MESLKGKYKLNWFPEDGPLMKIEVALLKDVATLTIDTTGPGLHQRGYRAMAAGGAPLKRDAGGSFDHFSPLVSGHRPI